MAIIEQEVSQEREIPIPEEVLEKYAIWRPSPLYRAFALEEALGTPAKIYFKNEGVSPAGSHKPNTAVAQAYYNKVAGTKQIYTETGAGQWGSALSFACALFGLPVQVFMVKISFHQKPMRRVMMETWGGRCIPSPSTETEVGRKILEKDPDNLGSLGIDISEGVEKVVQDPDAEPDAVRREGMGKALDYMDLTPGTAIRDIRPDHVFIGSCTNSRIEDLRAAAAILRERKVAAGVRLLVVPGSQAIKRAAEAEGIDAVVRAAGGLALVWQRGIVPRIDPTPVGEPGRSRSSPAPGWLPAPDSRSAAIASGSARGSWPRPAAPRQSHWAYCARRA